MNATVKRTLLWTIIAIVVITLGYGSYYVIKIWNFGHNISDSNGDSMFAEWLKSQNDLDPDAYVPDEPPEWQGTERVNILLMGGDARALTKNDAPRSDTMMVASLDPVTKQASLFSILRDTYVEIPGHYSTRINAALALGGPKLAMETVSKFLDIPIQYYVYVDFQGFVELVDAIGGIDYEVEKNMYYFDPTEPEFLINLKKGEQHLDGNKALQYVRFRHDAMGDYTRTERQRDLLSTIAAKMQTTTNVLNLPQILDKIQPYINTNLPFNKMLPLASLAYDTASEPIDTEQMPPMDMLREENIDGAEVITVDKTALRKYVQEKLLEDSAVAQSENGHKSGG